MFSNTYIDQFGIVALTQVVQHGGVVQIRQVGHVFHFLKLGRIDRMTLLFLERLFLMFWSGRSY